MSRVGKIARLPEQIREQINLRLENGEEGREHRHLVELA